MQNALTWTIRGLAALVLSVTTLSFALRWVQLHRPSEAALVSLLPLLTLASVVAVVAVAATRTVIGAAAAASLVLVILIPQLPPHIANRRAAPPGGQPLVLMSANLLFGEADATSLVATLRQQKADVFAAQELTQEEVDRLRAAGLDTLLPYSTLSPGPAASGTGLWSRFPLQPAPALPAMVNRPVGGVLVLPGGRVGPLVLSIHSSAPWPTDIVAWNHDLGILRQWLVGRDGSLLVAGDYNATVDHELFRSLLHARPGYDDAASQVGDGPARTYPAKPHDAPGIGIDHVLLGRKVVARSFHTQSVRGSDHRGIVVHLIV